VERGLAEPGGRLPLERGHDRELVDVGARDERLLACAGQNDRPHAWVIAERREGLVDISYGQLVQRVQYLRAVDRDPRDPVLDLDIKIFQAQRRGLGIH
jgi:hypothetical protein